MVHSFREDYRSAALPASQKALSKIATGQLVEDELEEKLSEMPARSFLEKLQKTANSCLAAHKAIGETELTGDARVVVEITAFPIFISIFRTFVSEGALYPAPKTHQRVKYIFLTGRLRQFKFSQRLFRMQTGVNQHGFN